GLRAVCNGGTPGLAAGNHRSTAQRGIYCRPGTLAAFVSGGYTEKLLRLRCINVPVQVLKGWNLGHPVHQLEHGVNRLALCCDTPDVEACLEKFGATLSSMGQRGFIAGKQAGNISNVGVDNIVTFTPGTAASELTAMMPLICGRALGSGGFSVVMERPLDHASCTTVGASLILITVHWPSLCHQLVLYGQDEVSAYDG
ncbi:hypothetical protein BaRGS_00017246, partial [Batillaria attramentaria]